MFKTRFPTHVFLLLAVLVLLTSLTLQTRPVTVLAAPVQVSGKGTPWINFKDGEVVSAEYSGPDDLVRALERSSAQPLTLASTDFDGDGIPDLVVGYASAEGSFAAIHRGNVDAIYPHSEGAVRRKAADTFSDAPFLPDASLFALPVEPVFIGAGDFNGDDSADMVIADREEAALYLVAGDGKGGFSPSMRVAIPGIVTALTVGEINRRDGLPDVVVGVRKDNTYQLLVFESPEGALRGDPEAITIAGEVSSLALGQLDDHYAIDLAASAGGELLVIHGRDRKLTEDANSQASVENPAIERHTFDFSIAAVAVGDFAEEEGYQNELALLSSDGTVHLVVSSEREMRADAFATVSLPNREAPNLSLLRLRVSSAPTDDLLVLDPANRQLHILMTGDEPAARTPLGVRVAATLEVTGVPMTVLPMRLNKDGLDDLVILEEGFQKLTVLPTAPVNIFVVDTALDWDDFDTEDGVCDINNSGGDGPCSLRAAIQQANTSAGADEIRFGFLAAEIAPTSELPPVTVAVTIDGSTNQYETKLVGTNAGASVNGLDIVANNCVVRGMIINRFKHSGILNGFGIAVFGNNAIIEGNLLGTDKTGTSALGNENGGVALGGGSSGSVVGGETAAARNLISGNGGYGGNGVQIGEPDRASTGNTVKGNYIGTDINGTAAIGNDMVGVMIAGGSTNNTIGGAEAGKRNIISGNNGHGVALQDGASGNIVIGNFIGTDLAGTTAVPNGVLYTTYGVGVQLINASNNNIGGATTGLRNIISGNYWDGVEIINATTNYVAVRDPYAPALSQGDIPRDAPPPPMAFQLSHRLPSGEAVSSPEGEVSPSAPIAATNNIISGNYIGVNVEGTAALNNFSTGIVVANASGNTIGGLISGSGNVVASNLGNGITVFADPGKAASSNNIWGNLIGTDKTGLVIDPDGTPGNFDELGNYNNGVVLGHAGENTVGGTTSGARNVIAGNQGYGIWIAESQAISNTVQANYIGTNLDSSGGDDVLLALGNGLHGIFIDAASRNKVGGVEEGAGNLILFNKKAGVVVKSGTRNVIRRNEIHSNGGLSIDLGDDQITFNDELDADAGANDLQNTPDVEAFNGTAITGTLRSEPNTEYVLDFYTYEVCDALSTLPPGFGIAEEYLGATAEEQTDPEGKIDFVWASPQAIKAGFAVAATATDADGNTSELSNQPFELHASSPAYIPQGTLAADHKILLWTTIQPALADVIQGCLGNYDLNVVIDGDITKPLPLLNDGAGTANRAAADFNANDNHHSAWFTPTTNVDITLELYISPKGQAVDTGMVSSKLIIKKADKPKLLVLTDLRELFAEFNRTSANSATTDNDDNKVLDYYDALSRIYEYTLNHNGMLVDVRQNAYAADHNYAATVNALGFRDNMGREIDGDLLVKLEAPYKADLKYLAIIGDDAVVPFTRYGNNLAKNFDESNYDIQIPTSIGLAQATGADGNPTVADVGYKNAGDYAEGAIMSDVHFGSFKYVYSDYVVPDLAVGRIFYPTPGDLIDAIDIFEEPVDFRSASSNASAFHLSNEYRTVLVGGVATQVPNILFVDIFDAGYQPVFENHFGAANVHDFTRTDGPLAFSDGNTNIYNGTGNIWQFFAPWTRQTFARAGQNSDVMTIFAHSDHVSILTEQQKRAGGANTSIRATDFQNFNASAYTTPACHSGLSVSYQQTTNHRYYVDSLVLAGLKQHVAYFAPTTYGVSSRETASHHIIMTAQFINALYDAARTTMGEAYLGAFAGYRAAATGWAQYVPYGMAFYGLPTQPIERGAARSTIQMTQFPMIGPAPARVQESTPFTLTETLTLTHFSVSYDANGLARFDVPQQGTVTAEDFGPVVPVIYRTYPLPMAAEAVTVTILDSQSHLYPIPVDLQTSTPVILSYGPLTGVFTSTSPYPLSVLSSREITDLGAKNLAISFIPLQYDPNTRLVTLYDSIEYQITYQAPTATTIENLSINAGTPFDVGNPVIPVSLTITSTANITGTLVWAVENGDRFTQNSGFSEIVLVPGKTQINWNLDTAGWEPGRKHMWVALQNENGEVIASGWDDFTANGEVLTVGTPTSLYSSQNTQAEIRASVRDATGVGQPGRASDLHLWVNGIVSSSAWNEGADGVYTTTIPLGGLTGGAMFTVTLDTSVYLNHLLAPVAVELGQVGAFQIDTEIPTSTVTISSTGASNFVMVFADYMDDIGISEIAIEYQVDGGDWQIWQTFNPSYKATILVDFGPDFPTSIDLFQHRYCFRSQAIDSVGNVEPIHSEPDACTPIPGFRIYLPLVMQNYSPPPPPPLGTRYIKRYGSDASDCTDPANPCGSIQYAIDQAAEGNEIRIAGYTDAYTGGDSEGDTRWTYWATSYRPAPIGYDGPENIMQAVYIDKSVTLRGGYSTDFQDWDPDTYKTVLIPGLNGFVGRVVYITPHAAPTLEHLHIIEGDATNLGGFYNLFVDYESAGAGIFADGEFSTTVPVTISNCTVAYNRSSTTYNADGGGITIQHRDQAVLKDNIVHHNTAYQGGGQAYGWGGGVLINDSDNVLIDGNTIYSNTAVTGYGRGSGGGIRFYDANGAVLTNNHIYGNIANEAGGGLHARFSDNLTFKDNVFEGNLAGTNRYATGGGIDLWYVNGLTISGNEFDSNVASISVDDHGLGGGIYLSEVTNGIVSNNTIHNNTGNNVFLGSAGGIGLWVAENIVIRENDIQGNVATLNPNPDTNSVGGGIRISLNSTDIKLINNNIVKNAASGGGGGIFMVGYVDNNSTVTLLHNTISNNTSPSAIQGAERDSGVLPLLQLAADPDSSGYAELAFIIEQNDANQTLGKAAVEDQGVLIPYGVVLNGVNNIISGHDMGIAATYPTSSTLSLDYTLWWANTTDLATGIPHTNDRFGDPLFTTDYHLQVGSPAIDQGRDAGIATDIDGDARPLGGGFDIGADEFVGGRAKEKWKQISSRLRR